MIGVLGCASAVGRNFTRLLWEKHPTSLRLAVGAHEAPARTRQERVDVFDHKALTRFARECRVVVNHLDLPPACAAELARTVIGSGASFVDTAGGLDLLDLHTRFADQVAVLNADAAQGCAGLLSRYLLAGNEWNAEAITVHTGGLHRLSTSSAHGIATHLSRFPADRLTAWNGGDSSNIATVHNADCLFPASAVAIPMLRNDLRRMAERWDLHNAVWSTVLDGQLTTAAARTIGLTADDLIAASERDSATSLPYLMSVARVTTHRAPHHTAVLKLHNPAAVTAMVAAACVREIELGMAPSGTHYAAEVLASGQALKEITQHPQVAMLTTILHSDRHLRLDPARTPPNASVCADF